VDGTEKIREPRKTRLLGKGGVTMTRIWDLHEEGLRNFDKRCDQFMDALKEMDYDVKTLQMMLATELARRSFGMNDQENGTAFEQKYPQYLKAMAMVQEERLKKQNPYKREG
jgi:hypothetical protein